MGLKEEWSFLDKISMGAKGTKKITEILNTAGHHIIELERYSSSNKIWATKIKRLRIPDLLCLKCGKRIEARAKSKLGIIMSDSLNNKDRRWFVGLRDDDMVAFISCQKEGVAKWIPSNSINLFRISDLKACEANGDTVLGSPKSASEGAERDRTWKSYVPTFSGKVISIEENKIKFLKDNNRNQTYNVPENYTIYIKNNDQIEGKSIIACSVVKNKMEINCDCSSYNYNFLEDLYSEDIATKYGAVKALGHLPDYAETSIPKLNDLLSQHLDERVHLELLCSLLRLGEDKWEQIETKFSNTMDQAMKMEIILILGELLNFGQARKILVSIASNLELDSELRACAIWNLGSKSELHPQILHFIADPDELVALHTISIIEKNLNPEITRNLLLCLGTNHRLSASAAKILSSSDFLDDNLIFEKMIREQDITKKRWLLYVIGISGRERFENLMNGVEGQLGTDEVAELFWDYHSNWVTPEIVNKINFIKLQN
ncbi:hypothetical protein [Bacillus atrophaeus]|uniref:hypothetical protein n=1 Tax=Bacillus atrophaeus TaxID=1452 RepID=UPI002282646A|nr:hypothetical protein [Bacillus atrophaeus]MCY8506483.1 hypothetical protein [Bacillus atrophaeus]MCY8950896.1 hypothetical protein [Bacillus atrophaeus]MCY8967782.1 hypothetical protein [Bacillus atrophaeus]